METNKIKNWKVAYQGADCQTALNVLQNQVFAIPHEDPFTGPFAISAPTGRIFTEYSPNLTLKPNEIIGDWTILVPNREKEERLIEIINWMKRTNCTGLSHPHINNMSLADIWEHISAHVGSDEMKAYKMLKYYFENNIYKKN